MMKKYISIEDAKTYFESIYQRWPNHLQTELDHLAAMPKIEARPIVYGQWVVNSNTDIICSFCGKQSLDATIGTANFCPHCGSVMK